MPYKLQNAEVSVLFSYNKGTSCDKNFGPGNNKIYSLSLYRSLENSHVQKDKSGKEWKKTRKEWKGCHLR